MTQTPQQDYNLICMEEDRDYWKCEYDCQKARADAAEFRERRLKEVIEEYLPDILPVQRALIKRVISTLYPDTPAPKEDE